MSNLCDIKECQNPTSISLHWFIEENAILNHKMDFSFCSEHYEALRVLLGERKK